MIEMGNCGFCYNGICECMGVKFAIVLLYLPMFSSPKSRKSPIYQCLSCQNLQSTYLPKFYLAKVLLYTVLMMIPLFMAVSCHHRCVDNFYSNYMRHIRELLGPNSEHALQSTGLAWIMTSIM